ncbi:MAG: isopeptide-forming domain-containing fimbrial protein, partial [Coriobacteriia bacterium]|nr:isopeptide-forming domain-containing fimbrial protein [Coriobacteriia bacterium]
MANHHKKGFMAKGTKSSVLRKALSYFLAFMLAVTLIPLASLGATEGEIIDLQDLLDQGYTVDEEGGALEAQDADFIEEAPGSEGAPLEAPAGTGNQDPFAPATYSVYAVSFVLPMDMSHDNGSTVLTLTAQEGETLDLDEIPQAELASSEQPFRGWYQVDAGAAFMPDLAEVDSKDLMSREDIAELPIDESMLFAAAFGAMSPAGITPLAAPLPGTFSITAPLGGGSIDPGHSGNIIIFGEGVYEVFAGSAAGFDDAVAWLNANGGGKSYVMYIGPTTVAINADTQSAGLLDLKGKVDTLVITGLDETAADVPVIPQPATADTQVANKILSGAAVNFGCNIELRNIRHTFSAVYMNGSDLTLGHRSWATQSTQYYGGAATGTVTGNPTMTVYSTGLRTANFQFVGGMRTGTLNGNVAINIHSTNSNTIHIYGAGLGEGTRTGVNPVAGSTATATGTVTNGAYLNGNAATTITGLGTDANGLGIFIGGVQFGNVSGTITNTISGPGRIDGTAATSSDGVAAAPSSPRYYGGNRVGNIGTEATKGQTVITNNVDFSAYSAGRTSFSGSNACTGIVIGNVVNDVRAGASGAGSFWTFSGSGALNCGIGGDWGDINGTRADRFIVPTQTNIYNNGLTVGNVDEAFAAAKERAMTRGFAHFGDTTSVVHEGRISHGVSDGYVRGVGWGYYEGNGYLELGTLGAQSGRGVIAGGTTGRTSYQYQVTPSVTVRETNDFDVVGGGGSSGFSTTCFAIKGDTTVVMNSISARWTYAGSFGGCQIGDSLMIQNGGRTNTTEGAGYLARVHIGNSRAELYGGQVDGFFTGGSWGDYYQVGNTSVEVFDSPYLQSHNIPVIVNASMSGSFGYRDTAYISGDSDIVVRGGDFSGLATSNYVAAGFSPGPADYGFIGGNASMTVDLRGNQNGFKISAAGSGTTNMVSGGRSNVAIGNNILGTSSDNTITLNILADEHTSPSASLAGLTVYGDASNNNNGFTAVGGTAREPYTRAGTIIMNINAPGANIGTVVGTRHNPLNILPTGAGPQQNQIQRDVTVNLVSAGSIQGINLLSNVGTVVGTSPTAANITNTVASVSQNRATLNVGPRPMPAGWDETPIWLGGDGPWPLHDYEPGVGADGYPHRIKVTDDGIYNFTSADISKRLLIAEGGTTSIRNGRFASQSNHGTTYHEFGNVLLRDVAGLGVTGNAADFLVGRLDVNEKNYIASQGRNNQVVITDTNLNPNDDTDHLIWLKYGNANPISMNPLTSWFGADQAFPVLTFSPVANRLNADKVSPVNLTGVEVATGRTYIGDNQVPAATNGLGVALPGSSYRWQVIDGPDNVSLGTISYNMPGVFNMGTSRPPAGTYLDAFGTSPMNTPTRSGSVAIPTARIPNPVGYPEFTFTPDPVRGEWVYDLQVKRTDHYLTTPLGANNYVEGEQAVEDYIFDPASRIRSWKASGDDKEYSFDITVDYTSLPELNASSVILRESEARALVYDGDTRKTDAQIRDAIYRVTQALGRPFMTNDIVIAAAVAALGEPLGELESSRSYPVTYATHETNGGRQTMSKTVTIVVVPEDAVIIGNNALVAKDTTMQVPDARAITAQTYGVSPASLESTHIDWWTGAKVITIENDAVIEQYAALADAAAKVAAFQGTTEKSSIPLSYSYTFTDDNEVAHVLNKDVTAYILGAYFTGTLWEDANGNGAIDALETTRFANKTVQLYKADGTLVATTTTDEGGFYSFGADFSEAFTIGEGAYYVKFPDLSPYGITTPYNASLRTADLTVSWAGTYNYTNNAGYKLPTNVDELADSLSKTIWDGTSYASGRTITSSQEVLEYRLQFTMPTDIAGYQTLRINDILPDGLVFADTEPNAFVIRIGGTSPTTGTAYTVDPAMLTSEPGLVSYLMTDFASLAGETINIYVKSKLERVNGSYPTQITNRVQLVLNANESGEGLGDTPVTGPVVSNTGLIHGYAFMDTNRNGIFDLSENGIAGVVVAIKVWDGTEYVPYTLGVSDIATTTALGAYRFEVPPGIYRIEFPTPVDGMGITTSGTGYAPMTGVVDGIVISLGTDQEQSRQVQAGYNTPDPRVLDEIKASFSKTVDNGEGTFVKTRSVTDINEELLYKISFLVPEAPADINGTFAGFSSIELKDVMDAGLAFASVSAGGWNWQVKAGATVVASGIATGSTVDYTFVAAQIEQHLATAPAGTEVALMVKANMAQVDGKWPVELTNNGYLTINGADTPDAEEELVLDALGQEPVITFLEKPLVVEQTPNSSYVMTKDDLCAFLTVTDVEDYPTWLSDSDGRAQDLYTSMVVTVLNEAGQPTTINTMNIGVYKVRYVATDSTGNETTAYRAVVVDDGRYIVDPDDGEGGIIIGARNFVIKQAAVTENVTHIRNLSYAEAFDAEGNKLEVFLKDGIPAGYTQGSAAPGPYDFVWAVDGYESVKEIVGLVVLADVVDPGTKDSQYGIYASHFMVNTTEAADIIRDQDQSFIDAANANVVILVPGSKPAHVIVTDRGSFAASQGTYPISFAISEVPATVQSAKINGIVSDGEPPIIHASSPVEIWVGQAADKPANAITAAQWTGNMYQVTAIDPDGDGKAGEPGVDTNIPRDITSQVVATAVGAPVDTAALGIYKINYSVTDADGNTATTDRLVIVNDGRYEVGPGEEGNSSGARILYADSFVIKSSSVASDAAGQLAQVRGNTAAKLYAGSNESSTINAGDMLAGNLISFPDLGGYCADEATYNITVNGVENPASAGPIVRIVQAKVVDADYVISGPMGETENTYHIYGSDIVLTPVQADDIQLHASGLMTTLINALGAGADKSLPGGALAPVGVEIIDFGGFNTRETGQQVTGTFQVIVRDIDGVNTLPLTVTVALGELPVITAVPKPLKIPITAEPGTVTLAQLMSGVTAWDEEDGDLTSEVTIVGGMPTIATDVFSVTQVTYTVTDSAG